MLNVTYKPFMLSVAVLSVITLNVVMLNVTYNSFMLSVIMLSVIILNVVMLSVVAPSNTLQFRQTLDGSVLASYKRSSLLLKFSDITQR
jgi:hypothetical protein